MSLQTSCPDGVSKPGEHGVSEYPTTYADCTPTSLFDAYESLQLYVNGNGVHQPLVRKVKDPIKLFQKRSVDMSLAPADRVLANLAIRALVTPLSSVAAERAGSYLRKLGAGKDRNKMGEEALEDNRWRITLFMWANKHYGNKLMVIASNRASLVAKSLAVRATRTDDANKVTEQAQDLVQHPPAKRTKEQERQAAEKADRPTGKGLQQSSASLKPSQLPTSQQNVMAFFTPVSSKLKNVILETGGGEDAIVDLSGEKEKEKNNTDGVASSNAAATITMDDDDDDECSLQAKEITKKRYRKTKVCTTTSSSRVGSKRQQEVEEHDDNNDEEEEDDDDDDDGSYSIDKKRHRSTKTK